MKLDEIAARIKTHLKRFEADPEINKAKVGLSPYFHAHAYRAGSRVGIVYVSFQGPSNLTREEAERYLAWLDAGNVGTHYSLPSEAAETSGPGGA